jgi:hypothetical protein
LPEGHAVTRDRARKKAIRARMAKTGEPYSVAARGLSGTQPAADAAAVREIIARAQSTLAAASARIEFRMDTTVDYSRQPRRPGPVGRLVRRGMWAAMDRIVPGLRDAFQRDSFAHLVGAGFIEPAAGRYMIDFGGYAQIRDGDRLFGGLSGAFLEPRHQARRPPERANDPLGLLRMLGEATDATHAGDEEVQGTACRKVAVRVASADLTAWIDDEHIWRVQSEEHASNVSRTLTLDLWDFGPADGSLDWSRLPSFLTPREVRP